MASDILPSRTAVEYNLLHNPCLQIEDRDTHIFTYPAQAESPENLIIKLQYGHLHTKTGFASFTLQKKIKKIKYKALKFVKVPPNSKCSRTLKEFKI